jgi:hypothetical protein
MIIIGHFTYITIKINFINFLNFFRKEVLSKNKQTFKLFREKFYQKKL